MNPTEQLSRSYDISQKVAQVLQKRVKVAQEHFGERLGKAYGDNIAGLTDKPAAPTDVWSGWYAYATDFAQRSILFWDTLRERGNVAVEHNQAGLPPLLKPTRQRRQADPEATGDLAERPFLLIDGGPDTFPEVKRIGFHRFPPLNDLLPSMLQRSRREREAL